MAQDEKEKTAEELTSTLFGLLKRQRQKHQQQIDQETEQEIREVEEETSILKNLINPPEENQDEEK